MQYRELGRTGMKLSKLGFGGMRFKMKDDHIDKDIAIPLLHRAFELGINFVDSAVFYCNSESESVVGEAVKSWKGKIYLSTKNPCYDPGDEKVWWNNLENSLKRFRVDCIDLYNFHGISWERYTKAVKGPKGFYPAPLGSI